MNGHVETGGDAVMPLRIRGPSARPADLSAVVDTGFNGQLTLPAARITALALPFREEGRYTLADNSVAVTRLYTGEIDWFGNWRRILNAEMDGDPLLGMGMLRGFHLGVDVIPGGRVEIKSLTT